MVHRILDRKAEPAPLWPSRVGQNLAACAVVLRSGPGERDRLGFGTQTEALHAAHSLVIHAYCSWQLRDAGVLFHEQDTHALHAEKVRQGQARRTASND